MRTQRKGRQQQQQQQQQQKGGSGSNYVNLWHAVSPTNIQALSQYTANRIDATPMFNPLRYNTQIATPTSGIIPTGVSLGNGPTTAGYYWQGTQFGGSNWIDEVKDYANNMFVSKKR